MQKWTGGTMTRVGGRKRAVVSAHHAVAGAGSSAAAPVTSSSCMGVGGGGGRKVLPARVRSSGLCPPVGSDGCFRQRVSVGQTAASNGVNPHPDSRTTTAAPVSVAMSGNGPPNYFGGKDQGPVAGSFASTCMDGNLSPPQPITCNPVGSSDGAATAPRLAFTPHGDRGVPVTVGIMTQSSQAGGNAPDNDARLTSPPVRCLFPKDPEDRTVITNHNASKDVLPPKGQKKSNVTSAKAKPQSTTSLSTRKVRNDNWKGTDHSNNLSQVNRSGVAKSATRKAQPTHAPNQRPTAVARRSTRRAADAQRVFAVPRAALSEGSRLSCVRQMPAAATAASRKTVAVGAFRPDRVGAPAGGDYHRPVEFNACQLPQPPVPFPLVPEASENTNQPIEAYSEGYEGLTYSSATRHHLPLPHPESDPFAFRFSPTPVAMHAPSLAAAEYLHSASPPQVVRTATTDSGVSDAWASDPLPPYPHYTAEFGSSGSRPVAWQLDFSPAHGPGPKVRVPPSPRQYYPLPAPPLSIHYNAQQQPPFIQDGGTRGLRSPSMPQSHLLEGPQTTTAASRGVGTAAAAPRTEPALVGMQPPRVVYQSRRGMSTTRIGDADWPMLTAAPIPTMRHQYEASGYSNPGPQFFHEPAPHQQRHPTQHQRQHSYSTKPSQQSLVFPHHSLFSAASQHPPMPVPQQQERLLWDHRLDMHHHHHHNHPHNHSPRHVTHVFTPPVPGQRTSRCLDFDTSSMFI